MTYYNFDNLESLKDGDILFFDELLNGNPNVLNACLTLLEQRRMISGKLLPDVLICAAANPQGMTPLTPQIKERFVWYNVEFDSEMWREYMYVKYDLTTSQINKLTNLIKAEKSFTGNNFATPRSLDKAINMMICGVSTPYSATLLHILDELITNTSSTVIKIGAENFLPNESRSWLNIKKTIKKWSC